MMTYEDKDLVLEMNDHPEYHKGYMDHKLIHINIMHSNFFSKLFYKLAKWFARKGI